MGNLEKVEALKHIEAEAQRLAKLAQGEAMPMVAYLLDVAAAEARDALHQEKKDSRDR